MVRFGIVGIGNMGRGHVVRLMKGEIPGAELTAVCDIRQERLDWMDEQGYGAVKKYLKSDDLIASGEVDAVLIATPHYDHPPIAEAAFAAGLNVLIEKPAGVYTGQVRRMNEAAKKSGKLFGIMYNQRTNPVFRKVRELVKNGEIGELKRAVWMITNWYRPQAYHDSSDWRSTWKDEGGGVLINQCPHQLDIYQWIVGMPEKIRSFVDFGKYYDIEVEDDVTAFMRFQNGATGLFVTCTSEVPGTNRLEIAGSRGNLIVEDGKKILFRRSEKDEREFNKTNEVPFGHPEVWECEIPADTSGGEQHTGILKDFVSALENGTPLLAPGEEGILGLSISNAIHMSAWTDEWVEPGNLDEDRYYALLQEKIKNSTYVKHVREKVSDVKGTH